MAILKVYRDLIKKLNFEYDILYKKIKLSKIWGSIYKYSKPYKGKETVRSYEELLKRKRC